MEKTCLWCNRVYKTYHRKQKFCNPKCQAKAASQNRKGKHYSPTTEFKRGHKLSEDGLRKLREKLSNRTLSKEHKEKLRQVRLERKKRLGYLNSEETRKKMSESGRKNPARYWLGKKRSKKTLEKISKARKGKYTGSNSPSWKGGPIPIKCEVCGKEKYYQRWKVDRGQGRFCSNKCRGIWVSKTLKGKYTASDSSNWKGGISFEPYDPRFNRQLRELIRLRDGYRCQKCGCPEIENGRKLSVHHIDGDKSNSSPTNLISLCIGCNTQVECNRPKWQHIFRRKIQKLMSANPLQLNFRVPKSHSKNRSQGRSS